MNVIEANERVPPPALFKNRYSGIGFLLLYLQ